MTNTPDTTAHDLAAERHKAVKSALEQVRYFDERVTDDTVEGRFYEALRRSGFEVAPISEQPGQPVEAGEVEGLSNEQLFERGHRPGYEWYRNKWIGDHEEMIADLVRSFVPRTALTASEAKHAEALAENARLLDKYGRHHNGCNVARALPFERRSGTVRCTCGFDDARTALSETPASSEGEAK